MICDTDIASDGMCLYVRPKEGVGEDMKSSLQECDFMFNRIPIITIVFVSKSPVYYGGGDR